MDRQLEAVGEEACLRSTIGMAGAVVILLLAFLRVLSFRVSEVNSDRCDECLSYGCKSQTSSVVMKEMKIGCYS